MVTKENDSDYMELEDQILGVLIPYLDEIGAFEGDTKAGSPILNDLVREAHVYCARLGIKNVDKRTLEPILPKRA
jgi:hypothetical protein